jgi:hypothetical protein
LNGIDVTYLVAYFKGGPPPFFCPNCPVSRLIERDDIKDVREEGAE